MKITKEQLRRVVRRMINEAAPGARTPGFGAVQCVRCGQSCDPYDISPAGTCNDCEWDDASEDGPSMSRDFCPDCGADLVMDDHDYDCPQYV